MSVFWRVETQGGTDWQASSQRAKTRGLKAALLAMANFWKRFHLPLHFQPGNAQRYGYQPRTPKYLKRKQRAGDRTPNLALRTRRSRASFTKVAMGGVVDLVYHGLLKREILKKSTVRGFPKRASVYLIGPSYFTTRPRNPDRPNLAREILTINDREKKVLRLEAHTTLFDELKKSRGRGRPRKTLPG